MEAFSTSFDFMAGFPAVIGLLLAALVIFLTSDWRLSLGALAAQYILVGLALTRFVQPEVAVIKILVGVLVVPILYLGVRRIPGQPELTDAERGDLQLFGLTIGWDAGPLGLPLRFLAFLLVVLAFVQLWGRFQPPLVPTELAFVAMWMGSMGIIGLVLGGGSQRVTPALLTVLAGFDLVYATLEPSLAVVGFFAALTLLTALAFSYLIAVQTLGSGVTKPDGEKAEQ
jgi:hypothetical protein